MNIAPPVHLHGLVFAAHTNSRGFAWVLFEGPFSPVAWAFVHASEMDNAYLVDRFERLIDWYEPSVVVLEAFEGPGSQRSDRVQDLYRSFVRQTEERAIENPIYARDAVQKVFEKHGARTRAEIANVIARTIDAFSHRMPRVRKLGDSEDPRQSLFDAAALVLTHFAYRGQLDW